MSLMALGLVLLSALARAAIQIVNKKVLSGVASSRPVAVLNALGAGLLLLSPSLGEAGLPVVEDWWSVPAGTIWLLLFIALLNVPVLFCNFGSLKGSDVSLITPLNALQPTVVLLVAMIIPGEFPGMRGYAGLAVIATGFFVFSAPPRELESGMGNYWLSVSALFGNRDVRIGLLGVALGGIAVPFHKLAAMETSPIFAPAVMCLVSGAMGCFLTKREQWKMLGWREWLGCLVSSLLWFVVFASFWAALRDSPAVYASAIRQLYIVFAIPLAVIFLGEPVSREKWLGTLLMVLGMACIALG